MGRSIKRVPMDFSFPLGKSYHDACFDNHLATCPRGPASDNDEHDECEWSYEPPRGEGWQLWETVSDGPISPVFAAPEELIEWMCRPAPAEDYNRGGGGGFYPRFPWAQGYRREVAEPFVRGPGWAPSLVVTEGRVVGGVEAVTAARPSPAR